MALIKGLEKFVEKINPDYLEIINNMREYGIIGQSQPIIKAFLKSKKAANSNANILIEGESGTGKEVFAMAIHQLGARSNGPFVKLNCAEIPETLLESELFGYEKGAFTGATQRKIGKFELANEGTIFLDEISEMSLGLQSKLLRVIEDKTITRVGGLTNIPIDVRILSATNRDLWQYVKKGQFREDLYYRLNVIYLHLPPLRERREDVPPLIEHFIKHFTKVENVVVESIDEDVVKLLLSYDWYGNVRQLENVIHHTIIMTYNNQINIEDMPENISVLMTRPSDTPIDNGFIKKDNVIITNMDLDQMEKVQILNALEMAHWNITSAAAILGIHRNTLSQKIKKHHIK